MEFNQLSGLMPQKIILNDIVNNQQTPIIDILTPHSTFEGTDDYLTILYMYSQIINSYAWSEIAYTTVEQFKFWFKSIWNRVFMKYYYVFKNQLEAYKNINVNKYATSNETKNDKWSGNDITLLEKGTRFKHERNLNEENHPGHTQTDNFTTTEYEQQTVENTNTTTFSGTDIRNLTGNYQNSNEGADTTTLTHGKTINITNTLNEKTNNYDYNKIILALDGSNAMNKFIDEFAILFTEVYYCE